MSAEPAATSGWLRDTYSNIHSPHCLPEIAFCTTHFCPQGYLCFHASPFSLVLHHVSDRSKSAAASGVLITMCFQGVSTDPEKLGPKAAVVGGKNVLQLLNHCSGSFRPGLLTAPVGSRGAGKTPPMGVLPGPQTSEPTLPPLSTPPPPPPHPPHSPSLSLRLPMIPLLPSCYCHPCLRLPCSLSNFGGFCILCLLATWSPAASCVPVVSAAAMEPVVVCL